MSEAQVRTLLKEDMAQINARDKKIFELNMELEYVYKALAQQMNVSVECAHDLIMGEMGLL